MDQEYYDIALSFAGEDRRFAKELFNELRDNGVTVFYDDNESAKLWGRDLYEELSDIYLNRATYCVMLISRHYIEKVWTNHERQAAQARAIKEKREYILPIKLDGTESIGVLRTVAYLCWPPETASSLTQKLLYKLEIQEDFEEEELQSLTYIPGWTAPNPNNYFRPELTTAETLSVRKALEMYSSLKRAAIQIAFGVICIIISIYGYGKSQKETYQIVLFLILGLIGAIIVFAHRSYFKYEYKQIFRLFVDVDNTEMGKYVGRYRFATNEDGVYYIYRMCMECDFPGCDGTVTIDGRSENSKEQFVASCNKKQNIHRYKVYNNGIAIRIE